jgi:hypothetical protein
VWAAWCQEQRDEVVDSFFVEPQNLGRLVTTWEPSHEWCLHQVCGVCTPSLWGLQWFTRKPLGYSVSHKTEAEDSTRRCGHPDRFNRPRGAVRPPGRSNRPGGGRCDCPGRCRREASKRRTRVRIARLASRLSRLRSLDIRPMKKI